MKKGKSWLVAWLLVLSMLFSLGLGSAGTAMAAPKVLDHAVNNIVILNWDGGQEAQKDASGYYRLTRNVRYKMQVDFDLSAHNGNLAEGDSFSLNIPAPISIDHDESDLFDQGVAIGHISAVSNGPANGGSMTVTLQNLQQYLTATGTTSVENIKGTAYLPIKLSTELAASDLPLRAEQTQGIPAVRLQVTPPPNNMYSSIIANENYTKKDGTLTKIEWQSEKLGKGGKYWHAWTIRVNARQAEHGEFIIEDAVDPSGSPWQYIPEQLTVEAGYYNDVTFLLNTPKQLLTEGVDYTVEYNSSYTTMKIRILNANTRLARNGYPAAYYIQYKSTAPADGTNIANRLKVSADGTELRRNMVNTTIGQTLTVPSKPTDSAQLIVETAGRLVIYKRDNRSGELLAGARFRFTSPLGNIEEVVTDANGRAMTKKYEAAEFGTFTVEEIEAPPGYTKLTDAFPLNLGGQGAVRTVDNEQILIPLTLSKHWVDEDDRYAKRPTQVKLTLYKTVDGVKTALREETLTAADATADPKIWERAIGQFPTHERGKEIIYSIEEEAISDYRAEISEGLPGAQFLSVTNFFENNTAQLSGVKTWDDDNDRDGLRPQEIVVQLLADGVEVPGQTAVVRSDANGEWKYSFTDLPKYKDGGDLITYSIKEAAVPAGYISTVNGSDLKNTHIPQTVTVSGTKIWEDDSDRDGLRPTEVTVQLLADGVELAGKTAVVQPDADGEWKYSFTDLPKYRDGGIEIAYSVKEAVVPEGYTSVAEGMNLKNTHVPETVTVSGIKTWEDADDQDGKRPAEILVQLLADGVEVNGGLQTVRADADGAWKYSFIDLPKYRDGGTEIEYTVKEASVPDGYISEAMGMDLSNRYTPETIQINGQKIWKDADDQDGLRPAEITVVLMADGTEIDRRQVDATSDWRFNFDSLPKYRAGQLIDYRLREETVAGYLATIDGYIITNTHEPAMRELTGVKFWQDRDNAAGKRPTKISLRLLADGQEVKRIEVSADANGLWKYRFGSFPRYQNGKEILYTVEEMAVPQGYEAEVSGLDVINTYTETPAPDPAPSPNPTPNPNSSPNPDPSPNPNPTPTPDQTEEPRENQKPGRVIPRTGEKSYIGLIIAAAVSAVAVIVIVIVRRKRS